MTELIETLRGARLTSVEFVLDYVQLRFDGPYLTINAPFEMEVAAHGYRKGASGYRDALCERLGRTVQGSLTVQDQELRIEFDDTSKLTISLKPEDQVSPEAVVLTDGAKVCVW
jgi:hypothetical protein